MILDSELDQGLIMSNDEITKSSIVSNLEKDTRLTLVEKCESLFALTYGEDLQETFDGFSGGYCLSLDYSELLKRMKIEEMMMTKKVDFYFDFASPNAYLSHKVMQSIKERTGAEINYIPVLLGSIFKLTNNKPPMEQFFGVKIKMNIKI